MLIVIVIHPHASPCIPQGKQNIANDVIGACLDPAKRAARAKLFESTLGSARTFEGPVFVMAVNYRYTQLMVNWLCLRRYMNHGDAIKDTVVVTQVLYELTN